MEGAGVLSGVVVVVMVEEGEARMCEEEEGREGEMEREEEGV